MDLTFYRMPPGTMTEAPDFVISLIGTSGEKPGLKAAKRNGVLSLVY